MAIQSPPLQNVTIKRAHVVLNPVSGTNRNAQEIIQQQFSQHPDIQLQISLTEKSGDATRFAAEAAAAGADVVIACGGDGTVMEVGQGVRGTATPMTIFPAGTANVMAVDLGIPMTLEAAVTSLLGGGYVPRVIDLGVIDNQPFLLRAGMGYEAEISVGAARELKAERGRWAYVQTALSELSNLTPTRYKITVDDQVTAVWGVTCMICNSASIGLPNLKLAATASVSDGLLDVIVIQSVRIDALLKTVASIVHSVIPALQDRPSPIYHWQGKRVTVETLTRQMIAVDGEPLKRGKRVTAWVEPAVVTMLVPPAAVPVDSAASTSGEAA